MAHIGVDDADRMLGDGTFEGGIVPKLVAAVLARPRRRPGLDRRHGGRRVTSLRGSEPRALSAAREAVLPTYARADITVVRGEGCRVWDDDGARVPRLRGGDRRRRARALRAGAARRRPRAARPALARLEPLLDGADAAARRPPRGAVRGRAGVLLQLGRRGERGGAQDRAQGDGQNPDRRARGRLPRADARRALAPPASRPSGRASARSCPASRSPARTTSSRSRPRSRPRATRRCSCSSPCSARAA